MGFNSGFKGLMRPYPGLQNKGHNDEHLQLSAFLSQESGGKCIWNIKPEILNLSEGPTIIAGELLLFLQFVFCIII